jgi:hypothetical protein
MNGTIIRKIKAMRWKKYESRKEQPRYNKLLKLYWDEHIYKKNERSRCFFVTNHEHELREIVVGLPFYTHHSHRYWHSFRAAAAAANKMHGLVGVCIRTATFFLLHV